MKLRSIKYFLKEGIKGLLKNRLMTIASIAAVAFCIFIVTIVYAGMANLNGMLGQLEEDIGVVVFLEKDAHADDIQRINEDLKKVPHVTEVSYIPPDEALIGLSEKWESGGILEGFTGDNNPLSSSFEISIDDIDNQSEVITALEGVEGIRKIRHAATETELLTKLSSGVKIGGGCLLLLIAIIAVVTIINTIKASIYTRRDEIGIMKLIGATDWFVRWPFLVEGAIIGIIGSVIPAAVCWLIYERVVMAINDAIPVIKNVFTFCSGMEIFSVLIPTALIAGVLLGVLGSMMSLRKHIKV
ncbi:MAG: permease-like cell division protein FtsX [Firmicutes bacterium]|nr:permease-like cell division protein FtsX [Bacillota bacterium]